MANTYEAIATVEVGSGGAADIEFTSIPATYTDLVLKLSARIKHARRLMKQFNNEFNGSTANYVLRIYGMERQQASSSNGTHYSF
jgi:hypothetical protein